jgi:hypothetical protein
MDNKEPKKDSPQKKTPNFKAFKLVLSVVLVAMIGIGGHFILKKYVQRIVYQMPKEDLIAPLKEAIQTESTKVQSLEEKIGTFAALPEQMAALRAQVEPVAALPEQMAALRAQVEPVAALPEQMAALRAQVKNHLINPPVQPLPPPVPVDLSPIKRTLAAEYTMVALQETLDFQMWGEIKPILLANFPEAKETIESVDPTLVKPVRSVDDIIYDLRKRLLETTEVKNEEKDTDHEETKGIMEKINGFAKGLIHIKSAPLERTPKDELLDVLNSLFGQNADVALKALKPFKKEKIVAEFIADLKSTAAYEEAKTNLLNALKKAVLLYLKG